MQAVVPYVQPAASTVATVIAEHPEEFKKIFGMAAKGAAKAAKSFRKKTRAPKKRKLESVPNTKSISHQEVNTGALSAFQLLGRKSLYATPLTLINPPNENFSFGAAPSNVYHLNGFKWCATLRSGTNGPINVHIRFVQPIRENATLSDIPLDMFIDNRSGNTKYSNFQEFTTLSTWDPVQDCFKLNRRKFNILHQEDFVLNGTDASLQDKGSSWKRFEKYLKCDTAFEFENTSSTLPIKPIWMIVYWESLFPSNAEEPGGLKFITNTTGYIRGNKV